MATVKLKTVVDVNQQPVSISGTVTDETGTAVADAGVLVVRKTWPGGRFRMNALRAKTDASGRFELKEFVAGNLKYEFLITVIEDGYAMTSVYRGMDDKDQAASVRLKLQSSQPVTFVVKDSSGTLLEGVELSPHTRTSGNAVPYLNYPINRSAAVCNTDANGQTEMSAWLPGEQGRLMYKHGSVSGQLDFTIPTSGNVEITLPE